MNPNVIKTAEQMKDFQEHIHLDAGSVETDFFNQSVERCPQLLYYIHKVSFSSGESGLTMNVQYRNQSYPLKNIRVAAPNDIERLFRQSLEQFENKLVVIVPANTNMKRKIESYKTRFMGFYPNCVESTWKTIRFESCRYKILEVINSYRIGTVMLKMMDLEVSEKVDSLVSFLFPIEMPASAKCFIAHNYLADTIEYCMGNESDPLNMSWMQSAYGALILKKCVCQGLAESYKRILNHAGVPCEFVSGQVLGDDGGPHAWNIVQLDKGRHTHIDVTYDLGKTGMKTEYLFRGDSFFNGKRTWDRYNNSPCTEEKNALKEAVEFCRYHRQKLLAAGLDEKWIV